MIKMFERSGYVSSGYVQRRTGRLDGLTLLVAGSVSLLVVLGWILSTFNNSVDKTGEGRQQVMMFCAAGVRTAAEEISRQYEQEYGVEIQIQYGGSNTLLSQIEVSHTGDLFLSADDVYITQGQEKGLVLESLPIAAMKPVLLVARGNPKKIHSVNDLFQPGLVISIGNPGQAAVGRKTRKMLLKSGHWEKLEQQVRAHGVMKATVPEVANDVKIGSADVGIVWNTTSVLYPEQEVVTLPELDAGIAHVEIGVLLSAVHPRDALKFARYVAAKDRGLTVFKNKGFVPVPDGDIWEEHPELNFYCGSVNRRAVEPAIKAFEKREGVTVNTRYDGCGILVGQMRTILGQKQEAGFPDAYMACDRYYLDQVQELFQEDVNLSSTSIVIAVPRGNPKQIKTLADLAKPGVRVALGQPDQCTIGILSRQLLESESLLEPVRKNVVTETTSSAQLVPLVLAGSVDAVLAYRTDTLAAQAEITAVKIDSSLSKAIQPFSIAKSSQKKYLTRRLYETVAHAQQNFESVGFDWLLKTTSSSNKSSGTAFPEK